MINRLLLKGDANWKYLYSTKTLTGGITAGTVFTVTIGAAGAEGSQANRGLTDQADGQRGGVYISWT